VSETKGHEYEAWYKQAACVMDNVMDNVMLPVGSEIQPLESHIIDSIKIFFHEHFNIETDMWELWCRLHCTMYNVDVLFKRYVRCYKLYFVVMVFLGLLCFYEILKL